MTARKRTKAPAPYAAAREAAKVDAELKSTFYVDESKPEPGEQVLSPASKRSLSTERFRKSDRLKALLSGSTKSVGYSCNTFKCSDSVSGIAEAIGWSMEVSGYQGAPSVDFSELRPALSRISTGGESSGVPSFTRVFDATVGAMRRPTKKNGAGIAWLSYDHPDLEAFVEQPFNFAYKGIYIPGDHQPELQKQLLANTELLQKLAVWYDHGKAFICKKPKSCRVTGEELLRNLCTEIMIPSRGGCILGVVNLALFGLHNLPSLAPTFTQAALELREDAQAARVSANSSPLYCHSVANNQFGLGVSGLASYLGNSGVTYAEFTEVLGACPTAYAGDENTIRNWKVYIDERVSKDNCPATLVAQAIINAYFDATLALGTSVSRAFCVQPSATGAFECADHLGYVSTPELQPPIGLRKEDGVHTLTKSKFLGDEVIVYSPSVETTSVVPYATYADLCSLWQLLLDSTGLGHSHSACWYSSTAEDFTVADLVAFVDSPRHNLYYRLPSYNPAALDKTDVGNGLEAEVDFDLNALLNDGYKAPCPLVQEPGAVDCDCAG
jgi:Ribonucleotide reductase, barrel domain